MAGFSADGAALGADGVGGCSLKNLLNIMNKRIKKKDRENTNTINGNKIDTTKVNNNDVKRDSLRNYTSRAWPMTPKAGVTLTIRRYQLGGKYGR